MKKRGISLIVLIITIIIVIILAAAVILTLSKNNPIESAKEARFKEDIRAIQDELSMYISKEYTKNPNEFDKTSINFEAEEMLNRLPTTEKYIEKVKIKKGDLVYIGEDQKEIKWANDIKIKIKPVVPEQWKKYIVELTDDGVPIPKGFTFLKGSKEEGTVIEDAKHNQFVWIPVDGVNVKYEKINPIDGASEDIFLNRLDETVDVNMYHGFYIGRYESTIEDETSNGKVTCKEGREVLTNINYYDSKSKAESMYDDLNSSVRSGLLTGTAWDTVCSYISDYYITINGKKEKIDINDSRKYGNYNSSIAPAEEGKGVKRESGYNENWKTKNIYDLAGNVWERTYEFKGGNNMTIYRGNSFNGNDNKVSVLNRVTTNSWWRLENCGFRVRLYIKTE